MADYSGAWHCSECGAGGLNYQGQHEPNCSVWDKIREAERLWASKEAEQKAEDDGWRHYWGRMTDDDLIDVLRSEYDMLRYQRRILEKEERKFDMGIEQINNRGLVNRWLDG